jgi:membrane-associated protein
MELLNFILHVDEYLANGIGFFGPWMYAVLFAIVFAETGLVVAPFLPGDSLMFAVGVLSAGGLMNIWIVYPALLAASILGDTVNYWIGQFIGPKVFSRENSKIFKKEYLEKTREFYEKHGGKTIILARFMPIVRTFAPFVAGVGKMHYGTFFLYNVAGGFVWVSSLMFAGYFFGGLPFVKKNFEYVVLGIVIASILPMIIEYIRHRRGPALDKERLKHATYKDIQDTFEKEHLN